MDRIKVVNTCGLTSEQVGALMALFPKLKLMDDGSGIPDLVAPTSEYRFEVQEAVDRTLRARTQVQA